MPPISSLRLLDHSSHHEEVRDAFGRWHAALRDGATRLGLAGPNAAKASERLWLDGTGPQAKLIRPQGSNSPDGQFDGATFRLTSEDEHDGWIVQVNLALSNNGDSRLARDGQGRTWLLRCGHLMPNGKTPGIDDAAFRSRFSPLHVVGHNGVRDPAAWYHVAMLDGPAGKVREQTRAFVRRFETVREMHKYALSKQTESQGPLSEPQLPYYVPPQAGVLVQQRQGKVLARLEELLSTHGIGAGKIPRDGFSCDAWIESPNAPLLVEIKTSTAAADIHMGIGQLTLYPFILPITREFRRVLLLPDEPIHPRLSEATLSAGFLVYRYRVEGGWEGDPLDVEFEPNFRTLCGVPPALAETPENSPAPTHS